jgi:ferredoxin--NADP+ reductase
MLNATIVKRIEVSQGLVIFYVKPDQAFNNFQPGQYVTLGLPGSASRPASFPAEAEAQDADKLIKRPYSIASSPEQSEYLELYIAIVPEGLLTSRMAMLKEGDRVFCAQKIIGTFTTAPIPAEHDLILVSTGTGIAPFLSMVRTPSIWSSGRKITIIHGARFEGDLAYRTELTELAKSNTNFKYYPVLSRKNDGWTGQAGYVQHLFEKNVVVADPKRQDIMICGNPKMIEDLKAVLVPKGYTVHSKRSPGNLHVEEYW